MTLVKFRSLYNDPKNRQIYGVVDTPTGQITVFEPSAEDVQKIMEMQDMIAAFNQDPEDGDNTLDISGMTILREIIPLLTDLEIDEDLSDEEFADIIENPSIELKDINAMLTDIITHVYTLMIREFQSDLRLQSLVQMSEEIGDNSLGQLIAEASKTDKGRALLNTIRKEASEIKQMQDAEQKDADKSKDKVDETAPILEPDNYTKSISKDLANRFSEMEEQNKDK